MTTSVPHGENLRRAVRWISDRRKEDPTEEIGHLVDEASLKFDLSPAEGDWLARTLASEAAGGDEKPG